MAERTGLEPATSGVTGQHSNQLNYSSALIVNLEQLTRSEEDTAIMIHVKHYFISILTRGFNLKAKHPNKSEVRNTFRHFF